MDALKAHVDQCVAELCRRISALEALDVMLANSPGLSLHPGSPQSAVAEANAVGVDAGTGALPSGTSAPMQPPSPLSRQRTTTESLSTPQSRAHPKEEQGVSSEQSPFGVDEPSKGSPLEEQLKGKASNEVVRRMHSGFTELRQSVAQRMSQLERTVEARFARAESDLAKLDTLTAELLQAQLNAIHTDMETHSDYQRLTVEELRESLQKLEARRRSGEGTWKLMVDELRAESQEVRERDATLHQSISLRVSSLEERMSSTGRGVVEWQPLEEEVALHKKGESIASPPFSLMGVEGYRLHFYPIGSSNSDEGYLALYCSGPGITEHTFSLFCDDCEQDSSAAETVSLSEGGEMCGFPNLGPVREQGTRPKLGVRLLCFASEDASGLVHRYVASSLPSRRLGWW